MLLCTILSPWRGTSAFAGFLVEPAENIRAVLVHVVWDFAIYHLFVQSYLFLQYYVLRHDDCRIASLTVYALLTTSKNWAAIDRVLSFGHLTLCSGVF